MYLATLEQKNPKKVLAHRILSMLSHSVTAVRSRSRILPPNLLCALFGISRVLCILLHSRLAHETLLLPIVK